MGSPVLEEETSIRPSEFLAWSRSILISSFGNFESHFERYQDVNASFGLPSLPFAKTKPWEVLERETLDENDDAQRSGNRHEGLHSRLQPRTEEESRRTLEISKRALRDCEDAVRRTDATLEDLKKAGTELHRAFVEAFAHSRNCERVLAYMKTAVADLKVILDREDETDVERRIAHERTLEAQNNVEAVLTDLEDILGQALRALDQSLKLAEELNTAMEEICYPRGVPTADEENMWDTLNLDKAKKFLDTAVPVLRKSMDSHPSEMTDREAAENAERTLRSLDARLAELKDITGDGLLEMTEMFRLMTAETQNDAHSSREATKNVERTLRRLDARLAELRDVTGDGLPKMIEMFRLMTAESRNVERTLRRFDARVEELGQMICGGLSQVRPMVVLYNSCKSFRFKMAERKRTLERLEEELDGIPDEQSEESWAFL